MRRPALFSVATLVLGAAGCMGGIGGQGGPGSGSGGGENPGQPVQPGQPNPGNNSMVGGAPTMPGKPGDSPSNARPADPSTAGPMPLRRLTRREYNNTVKDLLGDTSRPADSFPPDHEAEFTFKRAGLVATLDASRFSSAAESLAAAAEAKFATLIPCAPAAPSDEEPCARKFIDSFGLRAYRRPLAADEVERP